MNANFGPSRENVTLVHLGSFLRLDAQAAASWWVIAMEHGEPSTMSSLNLPKQAWDGLGALLSAVGAACCTMSESLDMARAGVSTIETAESRLVDASLSLGGGPNRWAFGEQQGLLQLDAGHQREMAVRCTRLEQLNAGARACLKRVKQTKTFNGLNLL